MSNLALWSGIVAFVIPVVLSLLIQSKWSAHVKAAVFFVVSLIAAAGTAYWQGDLTGKRWLESALIIVSAGAAFYHGWWKPSSVAPTIEKRTNLITPG
jgi:hypothetical protein